MSISLSVFQGRAGDRNDSAISGARLVSDFLSHQLGLELVVVGTPEPALNADWSVELEMALPVLREMQGLFEQVLSAGHRPLAATSRCAVSLATLPAVARYRKDACIVWFDAHADLNTPDSTTSGYLGGMALSGPLGLWSSGLGQGVGSENIVLVGQRDLDDFEVEFIASRQIPLLKVGPDLPSKLAAAISGRPVFVHLDCDVLNPGIVPTDYAHDDGLSLEGLRVACEAIVRSEVIGMEISEFQSAWASNEMPVSPAPLINALQPILERIRK